MRLDRRQRGPVRRRQAPRPARSSATPASRWPSSATALGDWTAPAALDGRASPTRSPGTGRTSTTSPRSPTPLPALPTYAQVVGAVSALAGPDDYALDGGRRVPRRAQQRLAVARHRHVRLRVRLLVHGLRDQRRVGRGDGPVGAGTGRAHDRVRRRRLVPDDEQRPVLVGAVRSPDDRHRLRQRRVTPSSTGCRSTRAGRRSTTCSPTPARPASWCTSTSPPTPRRWGATPSGWPPIAELEHAVDRARRADRTTVIVIATDPHAWTEGGAWWEVGVPEASDRPSISDARAALDEAKADAAGGDLAMADGRAHRGPRLRADRADARRAAGPPDRRGRARRRPRRRAGARRDAGGAARRAGARQRRRRARRRRRRRGDLHDDRHPRRADHDRRRGRRGDLLREADLARPRRGRRRAGGRRRRRRAAPRRVQPALRSRPRLGAAGRGVGRARRSCTWCGSPAAIRRRRRSATSSAPAGCSST